MPGARSIAPLEIVGRVSVQPREPRVGVAAHPQAFPEDQILSTRHFMREHNRSA